MPKTKEQIKIAKLQKEQKALAKISAYMLKEQEKFNARRNKHLELVAKIDAQLKELQVAAEPDPQKAAEIQGPRGEGMVAASGLEQK
jgi:hypothetical protein